MKVFNVFLLSTLMSVFFACKGESPTAPPVNLAPFTVTVKASPTTVATGGSSEISWTASRAASLCTSALWDGTKPATGLVSTGALNTSRTYTVVCTCDGIATSGEVTVNIQVPQSCTYTAIPGEATLNSCKAGEEKSFAIVTQAGCPINPQSLAPWLEVVPCTSSCNNVRVRAREDNNTGMSRVGIVKVADGCELRITQPPCPIVNCTYVKPATTDFRFNDNARHVFTIKISKSDPSCPNCDTPTNLPEGVTARHLGNNEWEITVTENTGTSRRSGTFYICGFPFWFDQPGGPIQPQTCQDRNASNFGGSLPCIYPQTCQIAGADNVGGALPCRFSDIVNVTIAVTVSVTCPDGSVKSDTVNVTGNGSGSSSTSKADATALATANANADAQAKVPGAQTQARANAQAKCAVPQTCQIAGADNVGGALPCRFSDIVNVTIPVTENFTCPDGSVKSATVTVTGNGSGSSSTSKADATALATANANADAQSKVPAARTQARANAQALCPACPATTVPPSVTPIACTGTNNGSILFTGCPGKTWVASSPSLISLGTTSGTFDADGKGRLPFTMGNNTTGGTRNGSVIIDGKAITIPQEGCATVCSLNLPPATSLISSAGKSNGSVGFTGTPGCQWKMSTTTPGFVYFEGAQSGTIGANTSNPGYPPSGPGSAQFSVTGNGGAARDLNLTFTEVSTGTVYHVRVPQSAWPN